MDPPPTNAILELWIDDGSPNITEPLIVAMGQDQLFFHPLERIEIVDVLFHIYNNASSVLIPHRLRPRTYNFPFLLSSNLAH